MIQEPLKKIQSSLKSYNQGLAKQNMLVEIPWTMVDGDLNIQRLIFRKDNSLYIVKEGEIQESKWEYLPAMNSLVLEIGGIKILLNEVFADGKALILKKDGASQEFLAFANQNELPDMNLVEHLTGFYGTGIEKIKIDSQPESELSSSDYFGFFSLVAVLLLIATLAFLILTHMRKRSKG